jgi:hypothetical protein
MLKTNPENHRSLRRKEVVSDITIAGGGLAGICCAIAAARSGLRVALVQDRPVLGGNASSEVRLWALGATSHMGNNNRWAREGGVIDEIMVENLHRNPEGNPVIFDTLLLENVSGEANISLYLNTAVYSLSKLDSETISSITAFNSQNSTRYHFKSSYFCDATGDGIVGFLAGAAFRMGAEKREEFGEWFAPDQEYGELLGHSIFFYSRDTGKPVRYVPPSFALQDITQIPRFRCFNSKDHGCKLWWIEWGGRLDTIHDTETIKWELWKIVYGVWDYIKNSGEFPDAANHALDWVGLIPGKRESRRFEGDYMLRQQDIVQRTDFEDAVSYGGWPIDLHPADGVYSPLPGCNQWHSKGIYQIPWRCLYSRNIRNLFLAGRIISSSHVAFGSTRVMMTCAHAAQAVGVGAAVCKKNGLYPKDLGHGKFLESLQRDLLRMGQFIPGKRLEDPENLVNEAIINPSSCFVLDELRDDGSLFTLKDSMAMMIPCDKGTLPSFSILVDVNASTDFLIELRTSSQPNHHTPDVLLERYSFPLKPGINIPIHLSCKHQFEKRQYAFICLMQNENVLVHGSDQRVTGVLSLFNRYDQVHHRCHAQNPPVGIGVDTFEFWTPRRRPNGKNLHIKIDPAITTFDADNLKNGIQRPTNHPNAWIAARSDKNPALELHWDKPQSIRETGLSFDTDFDHPMETIQMGHPERDIPFCIRSFRIKDSTGRLVHETLNNHQTIHRIVWDTPIISDSLIFEFAHPSPLIPAALFEIRCYG